MKIQAHLANILLSLPLVVLPAGVSAGNGGQWTGLTQCLINGRWVTVRGNCPAPSGGGTATGSGSSSGGGAGAAGALYGGFYSLGYAFGQWLVGGGSDPQAEARQREMMEELKRRQAEAERQQREEEARRLAEIYNRLMGTLKLSGLTELKLKETGSGTQLKLKTGDGGGGIAGLPGIYLDGKDKPYGVPGLPGIYTGGPGPGSGLAGSDLKLKLGDATALPAPTAPGAGAPATAAAAAAPTPPTPPDPAKMSPQQLADVAEMFSRLPPEEQARLMNLTQERPPTTQPAPDATPPTTAGIAGQLPATAPTALAQQAAATEAAAAAPVLEDAADRARAGFEQTLPAAPVQLGASQMTPAIPNPLRRDPDGGIDADLDAALRIKAEHDAFRARMAIDRYLPLGKVGKVQPPSPVAATPAQILRHEREALEPSLLARIEHEKSKLAAQAHSTSVDQFMADHYAVVNDQTATAKIARLVERIKALSPYPDDALQVRIYGAAKDPGKESGMARFDAFSTSDALYFNADFLNRKPSDDEILFLAGHELGHIQRDHYAGVLGATRRAEMLERGKAVLGAGEVTSNPKVQAEIGQVRMHELNVAQELEAERFGTTLALAAGAKFDALRARYARGIAQETPRSAAAEQAADHPLWRQYYEAQRKIWGDLVKLP